VEEDIKAIYTEIIEIQRSLKEGGGRREEGELVDFTGPSNPFLQRSSSSILRRIYMLSDLYGIPFSLFTLGHPS